MAHAGRSTLHALAVLVAMCALTASACGAPCKCAPLPAPSSPEAGDAESEQ
jgi:hypothetical protein